MADLFKSLKPSAKLSKNGFDLSRKHVFSSQAGMALPCLSLETVPGDHFEIDLAALSRTQTFNTAAFLRGKQRYDFFFVPYSQLWHPFNQFISQRTDRHSTNQKGHIYAPVVKLSDILWFIANTIYTYASSEALKVHDFMGYAFADNAIRLLDLLGYGDYRWLLTYNSSTINDDLKAALEASYGDKFVNPFRLAAYQHIWYDYYRNKYYDVVETGGINPSDVSNVPLDYIYGFNFDDVQCLSFASSDIIGTNFTPSFDVQEMPDNSDTVRMYNLLKLNYIQWKKDIFTTAMPSQQFGAVSAVDISGVSILNSNPVLGDSGSYAFVNHKPGNSDQLPGALFAVGTSRTTWNLPSAFDVLSLRKAEALQQWKQTTLRAGNMTDSSFEGHFGVKPYYEGDENVRYLGSFSSALQVNSVEATASTGVGDNKSVGDLAATGTMVTNGEKIKFDCQDFGIVMCIASYLPESEYTSNALDKANTLHEQFDWFTPEFQNIGLEAVTRKEFDFSGQDTGVNLVCGYAPRYYMYKTAVDKVFGEFKPTESLQSQEIDVQVGGTLSAWVSPRTEYSAAVRMLRTFYVDPNIYDNVMAINATSDQKTDYFVNNVFFDIKAIRPMSVLGLPQF